MKALEDDVMNVQHFLVQVISSCVTHYSPTAGSFSHKRMYIKFINPRHTPHQQSSEQALPIPAGWYTAPETCSAQTCLPSKARSWQNNKPTEHSSFFWLNAVEETRYPLRITTNLNTEDTWTSWRTDRRILRKTTRFQARNLGETS